MALQEGGSKAAMTGYGRLGGWSNTNNYNLNTRLYQEQWGKRCSKSPARKRAAASA